MGLFGLLLAMNVLFSSGSVLGDAHCQPAAAQCQYEDTNTTCRLLSLDTTTTCSCPTCKEDSSLFGSFKPDSLKVVLNYTSRLQADTTTTWDYLPGRIPQGETAFEISYHMSDGKKRTVCLCIPNTVTTVIAPVSHLPDYCYDYRTELVTVAVRFEVDGIDALKELSSNLTVRDCFETVGSSQNTVCGKDLPHAPINAEATVIEQPPGQTVVRVTWEPAQSGVMADWYDLDLVDNLLFALFVDVPGNVTQKVVTVNKTLTPSNGAYFKIRSGGHGYEKDDYNNCACLKRTLPQSPLFCYGTTATLQFPGPPLNVNLIIWPSLAGVVVVAVVITVILCGVWRYRRGRKNVYGPVPTPDDVEMEAREQGTVFLTASAEEDEDVKRRIRHLCHILTENGLTPVYYEYVVNDHSADSPSALGINHWVELQFSRCEFVLFVCTKRFLEEWNGERRDILSPLVYPCRNLLDGSLTRPQNISRFAVLFMGDGHNVPPILSRFRQFEVFRVGSEDIHADSLICYLLEFPRFAPPRIVNFFRNLV